MTRGRKPIAAPEVLDADLDGDTTAVTLAAVREDARAQAVIEGQCQNLARVLGYEGALSIGALEDGIRFYQRRCVESLLECGKRLLLLRELIPKGNSQIGKDDFEQRVEMLGFSKSTAYRFMQASAKTAKNDRLLHLADRVKSSSAFLELITHDDDADIERVAEMDSIERMSASQLRAALREARADNVANKELLAEKNALLDAERARNLGLKPTPAEVLARQAEIKDAVNECFLDALGVLRGEFRQALLALGSFGEHEERPLVWMAGMLGELERELRMLRDELGLPDIDVDEHGWIAAMEAGSPFAGAGE